jgi:phosphoglycolate phosphatase
MPHQALIFDLDGTLLDTLEDLTHATNHALGSLGHEPISTSTCRQMIGNGVKVLLKRATLSGDVSEDVSGGGGDRAMDKALETFLAYYHEHKYDHTLPFAGIPKTLDALCERGCRLAVLSNKPHEATVQMVNHLLSDWPFEQVFGQREGIPLKPDPGAALNICERMGIPPRNVVFVGDSAEDMATARAAGMFAVGVTWGLRNEPELREHGADTIIHNPTQLLEAFP